MQQATFRWQYLSIAEETLEKTLLESYHLLCHNNKDILDELLKRIEDTLCTGDPAKELARIEKEIVVIEQKRKKLVDMHLDDAIDRETYAAKHYELTASIAKLQDEGISVQNSADNENIIKKRITDFRRVLEKNEVLTEFDRYVFESIVDKVIVGGIDDDGNKDPSLLTFIYKTGFTNSIDSDKHKPERKNAKSRSDKLATRQILCVYNIVMTHVECVVLMSRVNC